jgi:Icc-related predicted phosphoesterase
MRLGLVSDLHGNLPDIQPCDILLIAGDICPIGLNDRYLQYSQWLQNKFNDWIASIPVKHVVMTWGNHDWLPEKKPDMLPKLNCNVLVDNFVEIDGVKIYGSPWQLTFYDWAYNLEEDELEKKYNNIPNDIDILITHGPPYGYGDNEKGSVSLYNFLLKNKTPLTVTGHIHPAYGKYKISEDIHVVNASLVNNKYKPVNDLIYVQYDDKKVSYVS